MNDKKWHVRYLVDRVTLQSLLSDLSHAVAIERFGPAVSKRIVWRAFSGGKRIALTFDDGPQEVYTRQLLEVLSKHSVHATFFLIGMHLERNQHIAREIVQAGHEIANHTFSHPLLFRLSDDEIAAEINKTDALLRNLNGVKPRFLRPPMGLFSPRVLDMIEQAGYTTVVGDVYPRDSHLPGTARIVSRVLKRVLHGSIIILHDGGNSEVIDRSQTIAAVDHLIPQLKARGYELTTLSELIPS